MTPPGTAAGALVFGTDAVLPSRPAGGCVADCQGTGDGCAHVPRDCTPRRPGRPGKLSFRVRTQAHLARTYARAPASSTSGCPFHLRLPRPGRGVFRHRRPIRASSISPQAVPSAGEGAAPLSRREREHPARLLTAREAGCELHRPHHALSGLVESRPIVPPRARRRPGRPGHRGQAGAGMRHNEQLPKGTPCRTQPGPF